MTDLTIEIGKLYDFVCHKIGITEQKYDEFIDVPFDLEIESINGYEKCSQLIKKQSKTVKIETEKGLELEAADEHILMTVPENDEGIFVKDLQVGNYIQSIDDTITKVEPTNEIKDVYSPSMDVTQIYKTANGMVHHNTHSVCQALKDNWGKSPLRQKGYKLVEVKGSIGESMSPLISFFYTNRNKKLIILDDCDSFLLNTNQSVKNLCKALLDSDRAVVRFPSTYIKGAALGVEAERKAGKYNIMEEDPDYVDKLLSDDYIDPDYDPDYQYSPKKEETLKFRIGTERLRENILEIYANGKYIGSEEISNADRKLYERGMINKILRENEEENDEYDAEDEEYLKEIGGADISGEESGGEIESIPTQFEFHSRVVMISNLTISQVNAANSAVASRCQTAEIHLTPAEFLARMGAILDKFDISKHTFIPKDLITNIKNEVFRMFTIAVELYLSGKEIFGMKVNIRRQLQFRMVSDLASKWIMRADRYCSDNDIVLTNDNFATVATAIEGKFFKFDIMKYLETGE